MVKMGGGWGGELKSVCNEYLYFTSPFRTNMFKKDCALKILLLV